MKKYKYNDEPLTAMLMRKRIMHDYKGKKVKASDITGPIRKRHVEDGGFLEDSNSIVHKETYKALVRLAVDGQATKSDATPYYLIHDNDVKLYDD